jgi:hypothetical protein
MLSTTRYRADRGSSLPRSIAAALLRSASRALGRLARRVATSRHAPPPGEPVYEFYAEAGAPEGAVYVDGQLLGHVPGVTRL